MSANIEQAVALYLKLRDRQAAVSESIKFELNQIADAMDTLETLFKHEADKAGVKSFKTNAGSITITNTKYASVGDWEEVIKFIKENDAFDLLNKAVNKTSVFEYLERDGNVPPGVKVGSRQGLSVRKPTVTYDN